MAVPKENKELARLLDKMLSSLPQKQLQKIIESWATARFEPTIDWNYVWKAGLSVAAVAVLVLGVILVWNRRLAREINIRRAVEQQLSSMASNVPGALFQAYVRPNGEYGYYYFSKRSEELFGFTEEEAKADPDILKIFPEDDERFKSSYKQAVTEIADWNFTGRVLLADGHRQMDQRRGQAHTREKRRNRFQRHPSGHHRAEAGGAEIHGNGKKDPGHE